MRRLIVPLSLALALTTGLVLGELRHVVQAPAASATNADVVHRFYAAVNRALLSGDVAPFDSLLAEDFVDHASRFGQTGDRAGLTRYVLALHRAEPTLVVMAHHVVAGADYVAARVLVDGAHGAPSSGLPAVEGRVWATLDLFRLREGRIAEHWSDDLGLAVVEPLLEVTVTVQRPVSKWVELGRLTYSPDGADVRWTSGPTVLLIEAGGLELALDPISPKAATLVSSDGTRRSIAPGAVVTPGAGDSLLLASGSFVETRNRGAALATVLVMWVGDPAFPSRVGPVDAAPGTTTAMATYSALASGTDIQFPESRATIAIGRVAMAPGAAAVSQQGALAEFVVVETGRLMLTVEGGRAQVQQEPGLTRVVTGETFDTGAGLTFDGGALVGFAPYGSEPLVALVLTVGAPVDGDLPAV